MTLNAKIEVLWIFGDFGLRDTFQERIAPKTNWYRHGQVVYEIFSIERRFQRSKSRPSKFKETCARAVPSKRRYLIVVGKSTVKTGCR